MLAAAPRQRAIDAAMMMPIIEQLRSDDSFCA